MIDIHHTAIIGDNVEIGAGTVIGAYTVIGGKTKIGKGCYIASHVAIGSSAEKYGHFFKEGSVSIGDGVIIREFVTVNASTGEIPTRIGNSCILLRNFHGGHDCEIQDNCILSCNSIAGGHSIIMKGANLGLGAILHQYSVVGSYAFVAMGAICTKKCDIRPGIIVAGNPAKFLKDNSIGIERAKVTREQMQREVELYEKLCLQKKIHI